MHFIISRLAGERWAEPRPTRHRDFTLYAVADGVPMAFRGLFCAGAGLVLQGVATAVTRGR